VAIVAQLGNEAATSAAVEARAYRGPNNLSDWVLPSKDELNQLYLRKTDVGGFSGAQYFWSSSQSTIGGPWAYDQFFDNGVQDDYGKGGLEYVRPVRAFNPFTYLSIKFFSFSIVNG
jgi:serine/threonine-protein kinase